MQLVSDQNKEFRALVATQQSKQVMKWSKTRENLRCLVYSTYEKRKQSKNNHEKKNNKKKKTKQENFINNPRVLENEIIRNFLYHGFCIFSIHIISYFSWSSADRHVAIAHQRWSERAEPEASGIQPQDRSRARSEVQDSARWGKKRETEERDRRERQR